MGIFLAVAKKYGVDDVLCIDGSYVNVEQLLIDEKEFMPYDLSTKCVLERKFDLALSLEVAEHIEPNAANIFCDNLTKMSDVIVFSAAIPKQGGTGHVNEQWASYWVEKFQRRGYRVSNCLRKKFWSYTNITPLRRQNILLFVKENKYNEVINCFEESVDDFLDIVHPEVYMQKITNLESQVNDLRMQIEKKNRYVESIISKIRAKILGR